MVAASADAAVGASAPASAAPAAASAVAGATVAVALPGMWTGFCGPVKSAALERPTLLQSGVAAVGREVEQLPWLPCCHGDWPDPHLLRGLRGPVGLWEWNPPPLQLLQMLSLRQPLLLRRLLLWSWAAGSEGGWGYEGRVGMG
jgi:hypothetical protein